MCLYISLIRIIFWPTVVYGWNNLDLQCRDNNNRPVDWWYMYKPPAGLLPDRTGLNFTYISSEISDRWVASDRLINKRSMLVNTLLPMYQRSYQNMAAVVVFQDKVGKLKASARGVLMAGEVGGFLVTHTVPGFPHLGHTRPTFPPDEAANGHLMGCVSLDPKGVDYVAQALHWASPHFAYVKVPPNLENHFLMWEFSDGYSVPNVKSFLKPITAYLKINGTIQAKLYTRPLGSTVDLYRSFAEQHLIHLNIYGQSRNNYLTTLCSPTFGVRNIDIISLKFREEVYYVTNYTDRSWFAVSTAGPWQQKPPGPPQYWTCTTNLDKEDRTGVSGILLCIENFHIWRAFDNLKVKEPVCQM